MSPATPKPKSLFIWEEDILRFAVYARDVNQARALCRENINHLDRYVPRHTQASLALIEREPTFYRPHTPILGIDAPTWEDIINYLEEHKPTLPHWDPFEEKWEMAPWTDSPRYDTLREALANMQPFSKESTKDIPVRKETADAEG